MVKFKQKQWVELEFKYVEIKVPVRYEEEDIPNNYPGRVDDVLTLKIDAETGQIQDWPSDYDGQRHIESMKVCDEGEYSILDKDGSVVRKFTDCYVPDFVSPIGLGGDYLELDIQPGGLVANWDSDVLGEDVTEWITVYCDED